MNLGHVQWTMELAVIVLLIVLVCWWLLFRKAIGFSLSQFTDWFRSLPKAWRYLTDREYRQKRDAIVSRVSIYATILVKLLTDRAVVRLTEKRAATHPKGAAAALDEYAESKRALAALFEHMDDELLSAIALYVQEDVLDGKVPVDQVRAFYVQEKQLLSGMPYMVGEHVERFLARFARAAVQ